MALGHKLRRTTIDPCVPKTLFPGIFSLIHDIFRSVSPATSARSSAEFRIQCAHPHIRAVRQLKRGEPGTAKSLEFPGFSNDFNDQLS
jgi:hypothetical protein